MNEDLPDERLNVPDDEEPALLFIFQIYNSI
jgi:hypothetical protein